MNRILNAQIIIYSAASINTAASDWDRVLVKIERNINVSVNRSTGKTPFELVHRYYPCHIESTLPCLTCEVESVEDLEVMREIARECISKNQEKMKKYLDSKHCVGDALLMGDIVAFCKLVLLKGKSRYQGPLIVVCKVAGDIYRVQDLRNEGTD